MVFCNNCGHQIADDSKFCSECGKAIGVAHKNDEKQRKAIYDGDLHKCPICGEQLNAFVTTCPVCNYELRGTQATSYVHELSLKLEKAETNEKKNELISNFYIPNTKEDICEFFILAYSNISAGGYGVDAWTVKLEQAYLKAKLAFGDSEEFKYIDDLKHCIGKTAKRKKISNGKFRAAILMISGALIAIVSLLAEGILEEARIYMWDVLRPIAAMGFVFAAAGLLLFVLPERNKRRK